MAIQVKGEEVQRMFGRIASRYDLTNSVLSGGLHLSWRYRLVRSVPTTATVLDVCTGTGGVLAHLQQRCRLAVGVDFCAPMLEVGVRNGTPNLIQGDALRLPFADGQFDAVTVAFGVRNLENLSQGLRELFRVLKPGGAVHVLEFGQPTLPLWGSLFHFYSAHVMPRIGGLLTGDRAAYTYLPETSRSFPCRVEFCRLLEAAEFKNTRFETLAGGIAYLYHADRGQNS
jgi:demethylmenaquinone methyltransferase/2-methoxy-6-polyprenyl-1,4-benzoquinol methylase